MRRRRKFTPTPRPVVPQVRRIVNGAADASATALVQDELAWVVYACNLHASEYCYWMLVAPSPRFWSAHEQTRQTAISDSLCRLTRLTSLWAMPSHAGSGCCAIRRTAST